MPQQPSPDRGLTVFFSAGEPSGDVHGANLIRALRGRHAGLQAVGYGGPKMAEAGCCLHTDLTVLAVVGFVRVFTNLHKFWHLLRRAKRFFRDHRPDAVVLIDFPGFNWWIARAAKKYGIPVFYYAPPQVWAWACWRVRKVRRLVDHLLCSLPFEQEWYAKRGCRAVLVGHPFFDEVQRHHLDQAFIAQRRDADRPLVTLLPGSRTQEVTQNVASLLEAAQRVRAAVPNVRFAIAAFKQSQAEWAARRAAEMGADVEIHVGRTPELIRAANCCIAVSGSVSLELLCHTKPTVILYKVGRVGHFLQQFFRKVKYITLVNLLSADDGFSGDITPYDPRQPGAEKVLFPEYLTCEDKSAQLAGHVIEWLTDPARRDELVARLADLKARVAHPGAAEAAAGYVLEQLRGAPTPVPRPHYERTQRPEVRGHNSVRGSV